MKRTILVCTGATFAAAVLLATMAQAEKGQRHMRGGGPPPCMDPMPSEIQTRLLTDFGT